MAVGATWRVKFVEIESVCLFGVAGSIKPSILSDLAQDEDSQRVKRSWPANTPACARLARSLASYDVCCTVRDMTDIHWTMYVSYGPF